jgi:chromosome segregation ATPase
VIASKAFIVFLLLDHVLIRPSDKTQVFHVQIEQKQKELQPWTTKINQKQAEIDIKTSERDMLVKRAETIKQASAEAQEALENLKGDQKSKVYILYSVGFPGSD